MTKRVLGAVALGFILAACGLVRSKVAQEARADMVGMPKEQVLACMGVPPKTSTVGETEVWAYTTVSALGVLDCTVNVVMTGGRVTAINYTGNTGSGLAPDAQCFHSVSNCVPAR